MDWGRISGNWAHWREQVQQRWGRLTNAQLDLIGGQRDALVRSIEETYGISGEEAERQLRVWERNLALGDLADGTGGRG